jgi:hypothetical protein
MIADHLEKSISKEEEYFFKENQALIERMRQKRGEAQSLEARPPHWMKCPKCVGEMSEIELGGIRVDQCSKCKGIYFDHGELEILIESKEPKGFLSAMKRLFH